MAAAVGAQDTSCACFLAGWHATAGALHCTRERKSKTCMSAPKRQPAAGLCGAGGRRMNDLRGPAVALGCGPWAVGRGLWTVGRGLARPLARSARAARAARAARGQLGLVALSRTTPLPSPPHFMGRHGACASANSIFTYLPGTTPLLLFAPSASRPPTVKPQSRQNTHHPSQPCLADLFGDPRLLLKWGPAMRAAVLLHFGFDLLSRGLTLASACCQ